ncbi:MAG: HAD-IB family phosphatase [Firmicutes bacterium]|nr:HAD-IB family phosphatase [Bacillota bacterium]
MLGDFVFISDFDGTITKKDFYWHIIDMYLEKEGNDKYKKWQRGEMKDIDFLSYIFKNIGQDEEQIYKDIIKMKIDPYLKDFIDFIHSKNGDFIVLSAGTRYYIDILFEHLSLQDITVYSNKAVYKDKGIHFDIDPTDKFYSERYGIDKKKVVKYLKSKYNKTFYAGDSMPDYEPSLLCDERFATNKLISIFKEKGVNFHSFNSFKDIEYILKKRELKDEI